MKNFSLKYPETVVWVQTAFIGDVVLTTAAANALRNLAPQIKQVLVTTPLAYAALKECAPFDVFIPFDKKKGLKELFQVKKTIESLGLPKDNTVTLQAHKSFRSTFLSKVIGFPVVTYLETSLSFLATTCVPRVAVLHECDRVKLLLEPLGFSRVKTFPYTMHLTQTEITKFAGEFSSSDKVVAVAPGSTWATKKWPIENYSELVKLILLNTPYKILLLGSKAEADDAGVIEASLGNEERRRVVNIAGKTSLSDLSGIFPALIAVVCNDSSPIHYASAFDVPTVAIFGATVPSMGFSPKSSKCSVVENLSLECRPCSDHGPMVCPLGHFKCMKDITPHMVLKPFLKLVGEIV